MSIFENNASSADDNDYERLAIVFSVAIIEIIIY